MLGSPACSLLSSEGDLVKQTRSQPCPAVPGRARRPFSSSPDLCGSSLTFWEFSGALSDLCGHSYAAGHPVGAQGLMHVGKLWECRCRAGTLGVKTLDKERKKRIGMKCILVQDRQFLKLKSRVSENGYSSFAYQINHNIELYKHRCLAFSR